MESSHGLPVGEGKLRKSSAFQRRTSTGPPRNREVVSAAFTDAFIPSEFTSHPHVPNALLQHCNPLSDSYLAYPTTPDHVDWSLHFPAFYGRTDDGKLSLNSRACDLRGHRLASRMDKHHRGGYLVGLGRRHKTVT